MIGGRAVLITSMGGFLRKKSKGWKFLIRNVATSEKKHRPWKDKNTSEGKNPKQGVADLGFISIDKLYQIVPVRVIPNG